LKKGKRKLTQRFLRADEAFKIEERRVPGRETFRKG
jgi:hypothetical protein